MTYICMIYRLMKLINLHRKRSSDSHIIISHLHKKKVNNAEPYGTYSGVQSIRPKTSSPTLPTRPITNSSQPTRPTYLTNSPHFYYQLAPCGLSTRPSSLTNSTQFLPTRPTFLTSSPHIFATRPTSRTK